MSSRLGRTTKILGWMVTIMPAVVLAGFLFLYFSPHYDMGVVRSESMKPAINRGDLVITGAPGGEVKPGTIVIYQHEKELVIHRVLSVDGDTLITKGDAVEDPDSRSVNLSNVSGVYLFKIPYMGYVANFVNTRLGWFLVIILPAIALVALLVRDIVKELRRRSEKVAREREVVPRDQWDG